MTFMTISEVVDAARRSLPQDVWDFAAGGTETEATVRRNRGALDRLLFRPRVLVDVGDRRTDCVVMGHQLSLPVMLAPAGSIALFDPEGAVASARAASAAGTVAFVSVMADPRLEEVAEAAPGPKILQIGPLGDRDWMKSVVQRAEDAGYEGLCLTLTNAAAPLNERNVRNRYDPHAYHRLTNFDGRHPDSKHAPRLSWDDVAWLRTQTELPLILKGIMAPDDAHLAVEHGANAVYVSNHGGLRLDYAPATIEVLPDIADAVGNRVPVLVDSGFAHGTDVLKALALGASGVLIGKLQCWGLAAGGSEALAQTLNLLREEMLASMGLLGVSRVDDLGPQHVQQVSWAPPS